MAHRTPPDPKRDALRARGLLNARAQKVSDPLFDDGQFFDRRDLLQVKYEMLRRVQERHGVGSIPVVMFSGKADEQARNLPYGDQRRLEIARALATEPKLLLLDEPTAGMNPQESARFVEFVLRVRTERDLSVLLIEHDMSVVMRLSERITVLDQGVKIAEGGPDDIRNNQRVVEAYLGKSGAEGAAL